MLQGLEDIAQLGVFRQALQGTDAEGLVQVGIGEAVEGRLEFVDLRTGQTLERIQIGPTGTERAVSRHKLADGRLLLVLGRGRSGRCLPETAILRQFGKGCNHRRMGDVASNVARHLGQTIEIVAPFGRNRGRVIQVVFIQLLNERRIAAEEHRAVEQLVHRSHRHPH
ncbi:hypothetical protein SDC9_171896 [bioreactor metagenome]|uniref:Uncharacterized protein n=1 Tax=bioreactor metagenome TaxID=1076179 RepID=A0A645GC52_9ZZZZ